MVTQAEETLVGPYHVIGVGAEERAILLGCACDIRDKYIQGSFMWDLGVKYEDYIE